MSIDIFDIIILIICVILSIIIMLFINRDKINFNCCKKNEYSNYTINNQDKEEIEIQLI